ncbi:MAG: antiviral reverse transcriptase Drt2 [Holophaga sp.]|jgi:hypothetical protein
MPIIIPKRNYLHFDRPFFGEEALKLVSDPSRVATWSFMPFLHIKLQTIKVKRQADGSLKPKLKDRPIFYASHRDAALYYYYSEIMGVAYEELLEAKGISECVTAFRKNRSKCNIQYANEVFEEIAHQNRCTVFTFDITSFFENIDHWILKRQWARLLGSSVLPPDHYNIFKSVTRYSYVERTAAFRAFGIGLHNKLAFKRRQICDAEGFRLHIRNAGLVQRRIDPETGTPMLAGIPQGSPISALLSNLYMLDFDVEVAGALASIGGMYRRYCDDIICVVPDESLVDVRSLIEGAIAKLALEAHPDKSTTHIFWRIGESMTCDHPVQYLGFIFDGKSSRLRTAALSRYYAKMRGGIRLAHRVRIRSDISQGIRTALKTKRILIQYSYVGRRNFTTYAFRAAKVMRGNAILKQLKPHLKRLKAYIEKKNRHWLSISEERFQAIRRIQLNQSK